MLIPQCPVRPRSLPDAFFTQEGIGPAGVVFCQTRDGGGAVLDAVVAAVAVTVVDQRLELEDHVAVGRSERDGDVGQRFA